MFSTAVGKRAPRVLFFTVGMVPTDDENKAAEKYAPNVGLRNAALVGSSPMSPIEECDGVAALDTATIPERYSLTYPDVTGFGGDRLLRMSDYDRPHGAITDTNNEAARAAKAPSVGADRTSAQGAPRPVGAVTAYDGGFVAPAPAGANLPAFGSERAENGPEGSDAAQQAGTALNPHSLPQGGVTAVPEGQEAGSSAGEAARVPTPTGTAGFTAPTPADEPEETVKERKAREARDKAAADAANK